MGQLKGLGLNIQGQIRTLIIQSPFLAAAA